ncbi:MAG: TIGR03790 family protein [Deltaproteobacteria bacterium]|nr:TIGR03790 family protein [Nannocystaceae bacterium]
MRRAGTVLFTALLGCGGAGSGEAEATTAADDSTTATASTAPTSSSASSDDSSGSSTTQVADASTSETGTTGEPIIPEVILPRLSIGADELGVLVNDDDPQSVAVAEYYVAARQIPAKNVVHLSLPVGANVLSLVDFAAAKAIVDASLGVDIQALAITWTLPYRVDCMSVTSAFALGFDTQYCSTPCETTQTVDYYDSPSLSPWTDHGIRPAMMLAGSDVAQVEALIDRGIASDDTLPFGDGYLIRTTDGARNVRSPQFIDTAMLFDHEGGLLMNYIDNADGMGLDYIENTTDVLFYFTGLVSVPQIATNTYLPGAMADHLTSYGGEVPTSSQMSCLAWLEAGATGSYGTVVEPCNYLAKFPNPVVATSHYFRGETMVEAYWKSVSQPGEGLFVGEPLARPWGTAVVDFDGSTLTISTTLLAPGVDYEVQAGDTVDGPWATAFSGSVPYPVFIPIEIADATAPYYRLQPG